MNNLLHITKLIILTLSLCSFTRASFADSCKTGNICTTHTPAQIIQANYLIGLKFLVDVHFDRYDENINLTNPRSAIVGGRSQNRPKSAICRINVYIPRDQKADNNVIKAGTVVWFDQDINTAPSLRLSRSYELDQSLNSSVTSLKIDNLPMNFDKDGISYYVNQPRYTFGHIDQVCDPNVVQAVVTPNTTSTVRR